MLNYKIFSMNFKNVPNWVVISACAFIIVVIALIGGFITNTPNSHDYPFRIHRDNMELMYEGARADLVKCIDSTMRVYAPNTCMNGLEILRKCEEYNIDLFFVLAQGHLESHFGTKGMALRTNSVFNVYAYDGHEYDKINPKGKYSHPDLSIEPYLKLLRKRYLVDGKTEMDMLNKYEDASGHRYATAKDYETNLTTWYHRYSSLPSLSNCFQKYTKYKILTGR